MTVLSSKSYVPLRIDPDSLNRYGTPHDQTRDRQGSLDCSLFPWWCLWDSRSERVVCRCPGVLTTHKKCRNQSEFRRFNKSFSAWRGKESRTRRGGEIDSTGGNFHIGWHRGKLLLKCLALISFRSDIIDFNEMFMVWSGGVAKSFASLPVGCFWGPRWGSREKRSSPCCQSTRLPLLPLSTLPSLNFPFFFLTRIYFAKTLMRSTVPL